MSKESVSPFLNTYAHLEPKKQEVHDKSMTIKASPFNPMKRGISGKKKRKETKQ